LLSIIVLFAFPVSWENRPNNLLVGNWATFSYDFGYSEFTISDSTIKIFSHWMGNQGEWLYELINDTIKIQHGFVGRIKEINDSLIVIMDQNTSDTLYRMDASTMTFNPHLMTGDTENDTMSYAFYNEFQKRAEAFIVNHNISLGKFDGDPSKIIEEKIIYPVDLK
jgi:hypothetical protein